MKVYVVISGERSCGGSVCGVFLDGATAEAWALANVKPVFESWKPDGFRVWRDRCDYLRVEEWEAQP